ncbi:hypothetical protein CAI21_09610 [Alkalilimnicola ehrlichii]|uniref:Uncharacterized protein n=1 Tax=Alkalilimnicola ehrlichii TaxID=351052 RepID=A0A3E0WXW4_9GAMM|nr:PD40 domain-containing protein [Alkalilimnicola ehrlichii]RFA29321.1 hypothetical protein CAI21_09610 [Alkalilimnicola ehrlichii]RFA36835.1 hypothetical protein CAL65_09945 [Alkalilimnicola ehrlichii]
MLRTLLCHRRVWPIVAGLLFVIAGLMGGCERADTADNASNGQVPEPAGSTLMLGETPLSGKIVYRRSDQRVRNFEFVTLDLATGHQRSIPVAYEVSGPNFSPTSNSIVFHITRDLLTNPRDTIAFLDLETGAVRELDNLPYRAALFPRFSPDGRQLAFYVLTDNEYRSKIYISDLDGQNLTPIPCPAEALCRHPQWHPEGNRLLYVADETEVHEIDLATEEIKVLDSVADDKGYEIHQAIYLDGGETMAVLWDRTSFPRRSGISLVPRDGEKTILYERRGSIPSIYRSGLPNTLFFVKTNLLRKEIDIFIYNYLTGEEVKLSEADWFSGGVNWKP